MTGTPERIGFDAVGFSLAPHIEDLVMLPTPVLRLLNVIDDSHLHNEEEYEGRCDTAVQACHRVVPAGADRALCLPQTS